MSYATEDDLRSAGDFYGVTVVHDAVTNERLLALAERDVVRALGARWNTADLDAEQTAALRDAVCAQALFRLGQGGEQNLGLDDGVASVGGLTLSRIPVARLSPEANEILAGQGLYVRTGTVALPVDAEG